MHSIIGRNVWFLCCLHYKRSMRDMFTERLSSDKLFQQYVSSMSAETVMRVDSVLQLILLRSGLLYLHTQLYSPFKAAQLYIEHTHTRTHTKET